MSPTSLPTIDSQDTETRDDSDAVPKWVWATLVMAGFIALSVVTMVLARNPVRRRPPPVAPLDPPAERTAGDAQAERTAGDAQAAPDEGG